MAKPSPAGKLDWLRMIEGSYHIKLNSSLHYAPFLHCELVLHYDKHIYIYINFQMLLLAHI